MPMNAQYRGPIEMPAVISVFPLPGALLLPRGQMPLNIFEPRYLAMVDDALRDGHRLIGMIQPDVSHSPDEYKPHTGNARWIIFPTSTISRRAKARRPSTARRCSRCSRIFSKPTISKSTG